LGGFTLNPRHPFQSLFNILQQNFGRHPDSLDERRYDAAFLIKERKKEMFGFNLLVILLLGERSCALNDFTRF
jgi:hypothetical protein